MSNEELGHVYELSPCFALVNSPSLIARLTCVATPRDSHANAQDIAPLISPSWSSPRGSLKRNAKKDICVISSLVVFHCGIYVLTSLNPVLD